MGNRLIDPDENSLSVETIFETCDRCLEEALGSSDENIIFKVPSVMTDGILLVEWLSQWQQKLNKKRKTLLIVAEDALQMEALELSHPDLQLHYFPSMQDIPFEIETKPATPPSITQPDTSKVSDSAERIEVNTVQSVASVPPAPSAPADQVDTVQEEETGNDVETAVPEIELVIGARVAVSGEYACRTCKVTRMWLKGDTAGTCENPECPETESGWKLTYELF